MCILLKLNSYVNDSKRFFSASVSFCGLFKDTIDSLQRFFYSHSATQNHHHKISLNSPDIFLILLFVPRVLESCRPTGRNKFIFLIIQFVKHPILSNCQLYYFSVSLGLLQKVLKVGLCRNLWRNKPFDFTHIPEILHV